VPDQDTFASDSRSETRFRHLWPLWEQAYIHIYVYSYMYMCSFMHSVTTETGINTPSSLNLKLPKSHSEETS